MTDTRERIRQILNTLPEVQIEAGGEHDRHLGASIRNKRFAWYLDDHHGDGRVAITCKAPPGVNEATVDSDPVHLFLPSYTGPKGWFEPASGSTPTTSTGITSSSALSRRTG